MIYDWEIEIKTLGINNLEKNTLKIKIPYIITLLLYND